MEGAAFKTTHDVPTMGRQPAPDVPKAGSGPGSPTTPMARLPGPVFVPDDLTLRDKLAALSLTFIERASVLEATGKLDRVGAPSSPSTS